jgi:PAS domain S-box-containing protein
MHAGPRRRGHLIPMTFPPRAAWVGYAAAAAFVAIAIGARWLLDPWLGSHLPFGTVFGAIAAAVWFGYGPAIFATVLGYALGQYSFVDPRGMITLDRHEHLAGLVAYLTSSVIIIALGESMRAARLRAEDLQRQSEEQRDRLETEVAERLAATDAARQHESRLRLITNAIPSLIAYVDRDGRYQMNNHAYQGWFGIPADAVRGKHMREVLGDAAWAAIRADVGRALGGETVAFERWVEYREGGARWIRGHYVPDRAPDGAVRGIVVMVHDITELKSHEEAVRASQQRFQAFMDNTPARVFMKDEEGRYLFVNRAVVAAVEAVVEDWIGKTDLELFPTEVANRLREHDRIVRTSEETFEFTETLPLPGGPRSFFTIKFPIRDPKGRVLVGGVGVDMTETRRAERAMRTSEEKFRRIFETANEGIWMLDADARVTLVNRRMADMLGYQPKEMMGKAKWEFLVEKDQARVREMFERRRAGISEQVDVCFQHKDGRPVWAIMAARPLIDEDGVFRGTLDLFTDVTERKNLEEELRQHVRELAEADRRKDEFLATLAHELRNPLAPIRNAVGLLQLQSSGDPELEQARAIIDRQVQQMVRLIDDLLDVSRITRGKLTLRRGRVSLADVLGNAVETSRPLVEEAGHTLEVRVPSEAVYLDGDLTRLAQVFANLLNNAVKYTERGGRITLAAERTGDTVVVAVRDTGIGIAPEQLPHIFEMFSQVTPALDRSQGGLGIGLSLVRAIVELHGGTITASSAGPGQGSAFVVRLPVAVSEHAAAPDAALAPPAPPAPATPTRVLVVDDNPDAVESLAMMLRLMKHEVAIAHDGLEALETGAAFRPDVALLDIGMPRLNGYDTARRVRELEWGRTVVLIALTGWGQEDDKRRAREAGFDLHMTKPVDPHALQRVLADLPEHAG